MCYQLSSFIDFFLSFFLPSFLRNLFLKADIFLSCSPHYRTFFSLPFDSYFVLYHSLVFQFFLVFFLFSFFFPFLSLFMPISIFSKGLYHLSVLFGVFNFSLSFLQYAPITVKFSSKEYNHLLPRNILETFLILFYSLVLEIIFYIHFFLFRSCINIV